ncbi:hypothetical protein PTSG_06780 [Salpingoeca rosetta]|uniref:Uncharacterized protein n=1 Tax=Salpingoeca rosetta (strain ATCC 50818 / BSB-021) TaxID=946362 RepID=F2UES5_SALR5|nr:uncharacterized protein PTSG_06780 [Salpingoeca rosetta]EGD75125.1 hypothetical protein PTSG_06780 [Salpingoeca rosetta]|eukprot:XP_004992178.1 hypothetical protein PTSG_06780 [Salpingoeca rosetta]
MLEKLNITVVFFTTATLAAFLLANNVTVKVPKDSIVVGYEGLMDSLFRSTWAMGAVTATMGFLSMQPWDRKAFRQMRDQMYLLFFVPLATVYLGLILSNNLSVEVAETKDLAPVQQIGAFLVPHKMGILISAVVTGFFSLEGNRCFQDDFSNIAIVSALVAALLRYLCSFSTSVVAIASIAYLFWTVSTWFIIQHLRSTTAAQTTGEQDAAAAVTVKSMGLEDLQSDDESTPGGEEDEGAIGPVASTPKAKQGGESLVSDAEDEDDLKTIQLPKSSVTNIEEEDVSASQQQPVNVFKSLKKRDIALPRRRRSRAPKVASPKAGMERGADSDDSGDAGAEQQDSGHAREDDDEIVDEMVTEEEEEEEGAGEGKSSGEKSYFVRSPIDEEKIPKGLRFEAPGPKSPGSALASRRLRSRRSVNYKY